MKVTDNRIIETAHKIAYCDPESAMKKLKAFNCEAFRSIKKLMKDRPEEAGAYTEEFRLSKTSYEVGYFEGYRQASNELMKAFEEMKGDTHEEQ